MTESIHNRWSRIPTVWSIRNLVLILAVPGLFHRKSSSSDIGENVILFKMDVNIADLEVVLSIHFLIVLPVWGWWHHHGFATILLTHGGIRSDWICAIVCGLYKVDSFTVVCGLNLGGVGCMSIALVLWWRHYSILMMHGWAVHWTAIHTGTCDGILIVCGMWWTDSALLVIHGLSWVDSIPSCRAKSTSCRKSLGVPILTIYLEAGSWVCVELPSRIHHPGIGMRMGIAKMWWCQHPCEEGVRSLSIQFFYLLWTKCTVSWTTSL